MGTLLVPVDTTNRGGLAVMVVEQMAKTAGHDIVVLGVAELAETSDQADEARQSLELVMDQSMRRLEGAGIRMSIAQHGDLVEAIDEAVHEFGVDEVVVEGPMLEAWSTSALDDLAETIRARTGVGVTVVDPEGMGVDISPA